MVVLPTVKLLNKMESTNIRVAAKIADPPLVLPYEGFILPLEMGPGALNYSIMQDGRIEPIKTGGNVPMTLEMIQAKEHTVKQSFYVDMFLALTDRRNMTATEVQERVAEKMLMLGPSLGRLMTELLDPIVYRTVNILISNGVIPAPPAVLQGKSYVIEYISPLAKAQRAAEVGSINNLMAAIGQMAQFKPEMLDKIDGDKVVDELADAYGVAPTIIKDQRKVDQARAERQKMQEAQMAMEAGQQLVDTNATQAKADSLAK